MCEAMDLPIEGLHEETGLGVMKAAIAYDAALEPADKASLFKIFTKIAMQNQDNMATFMAKWQKKCPAPAAIFISLKDADGQAFFL